MGTNLGDETQGRVLRRNSQGRPAGMGGLIVLGVYTGAVIAGVIWVIWVLGKYDTIQLKKYNE